MSGTLSTALNVVSAVGSVFSLITGSGPVSLDSVVFQSFEVPPKVTWGGTQALAVHNFPGGARVVDTMGPDEGEISWSGIILGAGGEVRAEQIDALRKAGTQVPLTWGEFSRNVVVTDCHFDSAYSQIGYSIKCVVIPDNVQGVGGVAPAPLDQVNGDLSSSQNVLTAPTGSEFIIDPTTSAAPIAAGSPTTTIFNAPAGTVFSINPNSTAAPVALGPVESSISNVQSLASPLSSIASGAPSTVALLGAAQNAAQVVNAALYQADAFAATLSTIDGNLLGSIGNLPAALAASGVNAGLAAARGYVARAVLNIGNA